MSLRYGTLITASEVALIGADGMWLGEMPLAKALQRAEEAKLDLVEINPRGTPPVCKLLDYAALTHDLNSRRRDPVNVTEHNRRSVVQPGRTGWTFAQAVEFAQRLARVLKPVGYHVGMTGSVLLRGSSRNDLDLIVYPTSTCRVDREGVYRTLQPVGKRLYTCEETAAAWRRRGSDDEKTVEVWEFDGKHVDLFFLS